MKADDNTARHWVALLGCTAQYITEAAGWMNKTEDNTVRHWVAVAVQLPNMLEEYFSILGNFGEISLSEQELEWYQPHAYVFNMKLKPGDC